MFQKINFLKFDILILLFYNGIIFSAKKAKKIRMTDRLMQNLEMMLIFFLLRNEGIVSVFINFVLLYRACLGINNTLFCAHGYW